MNQEPDLFSAAPEDNGGAIGLAQYAERAYLEYALSVVKGRALPDVCDGQKPVQRRILYLGEIPTVLVNPTKPFRSPPPKLALLLTYPFLPAPD